MNKRECNTKHEKGSKRLWITFLFFCFIATNFMQATNTVFAQTTVTATFKDATLSEVLWEVQRQTDFTFVYSTKDVDKVKIHNLKVNNEKIANVLERCLENSELTYIVHNGVIAITTKSNEAKKMPTPQQKQKISGTILDETGAPIIGANIIIKGTTGGTSTDIDGHFSLTTDNISNILIISYIGYERQEVKVSAGKIIKIRMSPDQNLMEEVVVTGYGTFKKSAYAGSASNIKAEKMKDIPAVSFKDLLQGNAPGVQFTSSSGQPGASSSLRIRGMGSFNASNSPLYVIDGVPMRSGNINTMSSDAGLDIMATINSSDIESITVIKDAAAASLYGSRAANGVVLITTKKGKAGKPSISLKADWGSSDFAMDYRPIMGGEERRQYIYEGLVAKKIKDGETKEEAEAYANGEIDDYAPIPWCGFVDWDNVLFQKGNHQSYEASISGGSDKFKYYSSLSYLKQEGIAINSGLERISGRLNAEYQATERFKLGANILFATVNQDVYSEGTSYSSPFYTSRSAVVPSDPVYNEDGTWNRELIRIGDRNPALAAAYDFQREYVTRTFNTIYGEYKFFKNLKLKSTLSYDYVNTKGKNWSDPRTSNGDDINGGMNKKFYEYKKMVWANQLSYKTTVAKEHHIDALAGYEIDDQYRDYLSGYATNFATYNKNQISNGMKTESVGGNDTRTRMVSYLLRLNYDYKNKYYLGGSFRTDGSSRFHRDNRWGSFWSVSGAWRIIEENFMAPIKDWLTDLKIRTSYGVNGTLPSDYFGYMGLSSLTNGYLEQPGIIQSQIKNKDLQWETNYNLNLGLDFSLWSRINFTIEYYTRTTKNLLMDRPISMTTGFGSYLMNIGKVKNKGAELEINSTNIRTKNLLWNTTFNISHNKNEIVTLDGMQTEIISGTQIHKVGKSYRTFYMIEFAGINPETGAPQFYTNDLDENGHYKKEITEVIEDAHAIVLDKHAEPNVIGGLSNSLRYKWFDLNFMFSYQFGGYSYDTWAQKTEHGGNDLEANIPIYYRNSWKQSGDITKYELFYEKPSVAMNKVTTTRRLHSTDFIRLKTLTFGVTLPKSWTRKVGIDDVRLYASGNNLWTWAAYDYYDPEAVSSGTAIWGTPPLKTVTFGININF
jgi:TonB-linked SusC/RagA family outer membrane protein